MFFILKTIRNFQVKRGFQFSVPRISSRQLSAVSRFLLTQSLIDKYLMKLYVGNLSYQCREQDLEELFSQFGNVSSVNIISDKFTGRSKGFAFIEFENDDEANRAIEELHETEFMQRNIIVNEARPREDRPQQRSYGGGGGDRNRGGGGDRDRGGYRR